MKKRYFIPLLLSGIALSMCISCKKDSVPSSPGQPALSKIIKDGALETEFLYESGKGLVRINYYDSETGQLSSFNKFDYDTKGLLQSYSAHKASGKITSERTFLKGSDGKFISSDLKILTGTDSGKVTFRYKFEYNAEGLISKYSWNDPITDAEEFYRLFYYYPNGNIKRYEYYMALISGTEKALEVNYTPAGKVLPASLTKYQGYLVNFDFFLFGPEKIQTTTFDVDYYDAGKFEQVISDRIYNPEGLVIEQTITTNYIQPAKAPTVEKTEFVYEYLSM